MKKHLIISFIVMSLVINVCMAQIPVLDFSAVLGVTANTAANDFALTEDKRLKKKLNELNTKIQTQELPRYLGIVAAELAIGSVISDDIKDLRTQALVLRQRNNACIFNFKKHTVDRELNLLIDRLRDLENVGIQGNANNGNVLKFIFELQAEFQSLQVSLHQIQDYVDSRYIICGLTF